MPSSCKEIRAALAECLQESECVMVQRHTAAECLRSPLSETLPPKCQQLKKGFGDCRRGMIDMRKRFRGNMPVTFKALEESNESGEGYQLYAGKSAFAGAVRKTDGNEPEAPDWREAENNKYRKEQQQQQQQQQKQGDYKADLEEYQRELERLEGQNRERIKQKREQEQQKQQQDQRQDENRQKLLELQGKKDQSKKSWFPWS